MSVIFNNSTVRRGGIVKEGLILNLDPLNTFSYNGTSNNFFDLSGNGYNGTLINNPTYSGGALNFNGSNTYVRTTLTYPTSNNYTMSCWFRTSVTQRSGFCGFRTSGVGLGRNWNQFLFYIAGDTNIGSAGNYVKYDEFTLVLNNPITSRSVFIDTISVTTGQWINIVATTDSNKSTIYYNAVEVANTTGTQPSRDLAATFHLGTAPNYSNASPNAVLSGFMFNGNISSTLVYNRALTPLEISQNFEAYRGRFGV